MLRKIFMFLFCLVIGSLPLGAGSGIVLVASAGHGPGGLLAPELIAGGGNNYNVWPSGDPAKDVPNVQWAVDNVKDGGFVRLKATDKFTGAPAAFDFGEDGSVEVSKSVIITGGSGATIYGGYKTFTCDNPSVKLEISNLHFDGSKRAAIYVRQSSAVKITNNVMVNLLPNKEVTYHPVSYYVASGIEMGSSVCDNPDTTYPYICLDEPKQLGTVEISNNYIDLGIYDENGELLDPTKEYPNSMDGTPLEDTAFSGIVLLDCYLEAKISGNTIKNTNRRAIHPIDTFGSTEIVGNTVELSPFSSAAPGTASAGGFGKRSFGIFPLNGYRNIAAAVNGAVHTVMYNKVTVRSDFGTDGPHGVGIIGGNGVKNSAFSHNDIINKNGTRNGIILSGNISAPSVNPVRAKLNTISHNTIDGSSYVPAPGPFFAHILVSAADSTTLEYNTYTGELPMLVILGSGTRVVDAAHPNTIIDAYCSTMKISFANLFSCNQP